MACLLHRVFDAVVAESILGDLEEERQRRARRSRLAARLWYWRASLAIVAFALFRRVYDALAEVLTRRFGLSAPGGDVLLAARSLGRSPWYSATVVGVVAMSMTLATTTFAIVDGVLFKPLPYSASSELFVGRGGFAKHPGQASALSPEEIQHWRATAPDVRIGAFGVQSTLGRTADLEEVRTVSVSPELLDVLGVRPLVGGFTAEDFTTATGDRPALISHAFWQRAFGGRRDVVGETTTLAGGRPVRVAGVLPRDFVFPGTNRRPDALVPLPPLARPGRLGPVVFTAIVRVPSTVPLAAVQTTLDAAMQAFADAAPPVRTAYGPRNRASLRPLEAELTRRSARVLAIVAAASGTLVLLACLTLAGLGIARVEDRAREVALRRAIGASGWAIARLQTAEALLLASIGTSIGVALAAPVLTATLRLLPDDLPLLKDPTIDVRVLLFAAAAVFVTSLLIALWPATVAARTGLGPLMARSGQSQSTKPTRGWSRRALVAGEVALALLLTLGGTLVVGSLALLWSEEHGYSASDSLIIEFEVATADRLGSLIQIATFETVVAGVDGVRATGVFDEAMLQRGTNADVSGRVPAGAGEWCLGGPKVGIQGGFFEAMGLIPTTGRILARDEIDQGRPVAVLSETAAQMCWEADSPIGRPVTMNGTVFTIVGVVPDVRFSALDERVEGQIYVPDLTLPQRWSRTVLVRTTRSPDAVARDAIAALRSAGLIDQVTRVMTMREALADSIRARRLNAWLFGVFAAASIAIVAVGILGLIAMATSRRTREIGIRYALGDTRSGVVGLVVREQVLPVGAGLLAGGAVAAWAGQFVGAYLYRFQPSDPRLWTIAVGAVITAALAGTLIPAWRASRVDPVQALRAE